MDNPFKLQSTVRSMQIRMLQLSKEKYFIFQQVSLILICFLYPKRRKLLQNMSSAIVIFRALRVKL